MKDEIEAATHFGEIFGFAGIVAAGFFVIFAWGFKRWTDSFLLNQRQKTEAEIKAHVELAEAQRTSYIKHVQIAEDVSQSVMRLEQIAAQNSRAVELIATTNETNSALLGQTREHSIAVHKAIRDSLFVAADLCDDKPDIQARLRAIATELN